MSVFFYPFPCHTHSNYCAATKMNLSSRATNHSFIPEYEKPGFFSRDVKAARERERNRKYRKEKKEKERKGGRTRLFSVDKNQTLKKSITFHIHSNTKNNIEHYHRTLLCYM